MVRRIVLLLLFTAVVASDAWCADALRVTNAGPTGEISSLEEANEIRVVFSEPMVALGKIPQNLSVPWYHVVPAIKGTFRWSGTTTLILTPDPKKKLPYATEYEVTIDRSAKAQSGATLASDYKFSFTTPTVKLLSTNWYRKSGKYTDPLIILLRFNQPIDRAAVAAHLELRMQSHEWERPTLSPEAIDYLKKTDPASIDAFNAKVAKVADVVKSEARVPGFITTEWKKKEYPDSKDLFVFETKPNVPPDGWVRVTLDENLPGAQGKATPGSEQQYTIELEPTFFVKGFQCTSECDPNNYDPLSLRSEVGFDDFRKAMEVTDVTDRSATKKLKRGKPIKPSESEEEGESEEPTFYGSTAIGLDEAGFTIQPAHTYTVTLAPDLVSNDGQKLGYRWADVLEFWHTFAFTSFGDGHGVWESTGGSLLPFYARNYRDTDQWISPLSHNDLMPTILKLQENQFTSPPDSAPAHRKLAPVADKTQSYGLDLTPALSNGFGLVWAAVRPGETIQKAHRAEEKGSVRSTIVQVTNLGISVKDSPHNTLIFVTRLGNAQPVAGAHVAIRTTDNHVMWEGTTGADGVAIAPDTRLRQKEDQPKKPEAGSESDEEDSDWSYPWQFKFIVTAEKDGDFAYVGSNWNEGIDPWTFDVSFSLSESKPVLRGTVFTDRGVYKLNEEVHLKTILRSDTPSGTLLLPPGTKVKITVTDSHSEVVDDRTIALNDWSSAEWTMRVPAEGNLGTYNVEAKIDGQKRVVTGDFLVAAYRRPDFRVDVTLGSDTAVAGAKLNGVVTGRYLFGSPMAKRDVRWTVSRRPAYDVPSAITNRFPEEQWTFIGWEDTRPPNQTEKLEEKEQQLDAKGTRPVSVDTPADMGYPYDYTLEGEVTDVSRQKIAGRAAYRVNPAPWFIGVKRLPFFVDAGDKVDTDIVAAGLDGTAVAGVPVHVTLSQVQWTSVRRAEGNGFYSWDTERKEIDAGSWDVTSAAAPVPLHIEMKKGGYYILRAKASDPQGHHTMTSDSVYVLGSGYTAWERYDNNKIDLVPEKTTYKPGDTARIMVKSPWEKATLLLTTEREGIRSHQVIDLTSTQQTVTVPITEHEIPNLYVSVLLVKGRTKEAGEEQDESDPGKPAFKLGYVRLKVEDAVKHLKVDVQSNKEEYRPGSKARVEVDVHDSAGRAARSEVTLWAVDYGVLSLTDYRTPNIVDAVYVEKALQVLNEDSRERIVSRRVLTPKGAAEGGGGGVEAGPGTLRKDFRVLAFWLGSVVTDKRGHAKADITLPESLTTYRIMAVAGDRDSRFGSGQSELRINKPVMITPAFPRFLTIGDKSLFGGVVHSQLKEKGTATVTMKSLDPSLLRVVGSETKTIDVDASGSAEVRFDVEALAPGAPRIQMSVTMNRENDAFEDSIPVKIPISPEVVAAYGEAKPDAHETFEMPGGVVPTFGGMHIDLSSTAMVGLGEGARYLVDYPYGCSEQRASAAIALMLAADLGDAFSLPGIEPAKIKPITQQTLKQLEKYQCDSGGFSYWPGECWSTSPYLTSYIIHVYQRAKALGYDVDEDVLDKAYKYLDADLAQKQPENESWWPSYTAWQAYAVKVLVEGGRNEDSNINRLYKYVDRMPVFALSYLYDAMAAKGNDNRVNELRRRISNSILPEGGTSHVEELSDPYLLWFWNSNVRSSAIVLGSMVRHGDDTNTITGIVRWLMKSRNRGRWGNTQENALAMEALVDYYRKYESEVPDFTAVVKLGADTIVQDAFRGRTTESKPHDLSMAQLLSKGTTGTAMPLTFHREGTGTLFYMTQFKYAPADLRLSSLDRGFNITREYKPANGDKSSTTFKAGDLVRVMLTITNTKERRYVAVTDPVPAGFEPVESWFATTASDLTKEQRSDESEDSDWTSWFRYGGFDHVERHDDKVNLFATRLSEGEHTFSYVVRATTAGTFVTGPTRAEEMYEPEVFGRTGTEIIEVTP